MLKQATDYLPMINKRAKSSQREVFCAPSGLHYSRLQVPLKSALAKKRVNISVDARNGSNKKKQVRWRRQMTQEYEMDEEEQEWARYEKLNTSLQNYISLMQRAKNELRNYQETVLMKPFYMQIIENSPSGSLLAEKLNKRKAAFKWANIVRKQKREENGEERPKVSQNRSFASRINQKGSLALHKPREIIAKQYFLAGRLLCRKNRLQAVFQKKGHSFQTNVSVVVKSGIRKISADHE